MLWFRNLGGDILDAFPRPCFLLIKRKDVLSQAVSHSLAVQSGVWLGSEIPPNKVEYSYFDIEKN
ncbi:Stf0 family sulfotransferase [Vreelandella aquamarina]|uniref:Stf0 family sulfotransferase n=1 Tax=Vreelandella aquamarina TaxID=77097 RepID=UPI000B7D5AB2